VTTSVTLLCHKQPESAMMPGDDDDAPEGESEKMSVVVQRHGRVMAYLQSALQVLAHD